jgi:hypothetical protein
MRVGACEPKSSPFTCGNDVLEIEGAVGASIRVVGMSGLFGDDPSMRAM